MCCVGSKGSGKTHLLFSFIKKYSDLGATNRVFALTPTYESNRDLFDWIRSVCSPEDIYVNMDEFPQALDEIMVKISDQKKQADAYQKRLDVFRKDRQGAPLSLQEEHMLENPSLFPKVDVPYPSIIIDDCVGSKFMTCKKLISLCIKHRHTPSGLGHGTNLFFAVQGLRTFPRIIRQNISQWCIFTKPLDKSQIRNIWEELSGIVDLKTFEDILTLATEDKYSYLLIQHGRDKNETFKLGFDGPYLELE